MVSATWAAVSFMLGLCAIVVIPLLGQAVALDLRRKIGTPYFRWAEQSLGQLAIVWRRLGRPTLKSVSIDDEREVAEVVQSSGTLSDDQKLPFRDPADAKATLSKNQLTLVPEGIPAGVDAEMAEMAHWIDRKARTTGLQTDDGRIDPHIPMADQPRAVNPLDIQRVLGNDVTPEDIKTTERHTRARFAKYGGRPSVKEAGAVFVSFGIGAGVVAFLVYLRDEVMSSGGGGGGSSVTFPPGLVDTGAMHIADAAVHVGTGLL